MTESLEPCSLRMLLNHPEFIENECWYRKNYDKDQLVILEGETGNEIYVILNGNVSVCTQVKVSEDRHISSGLCELFDGEEFAHSCFFDDEPHSATIKTVSPCELAVIDAAKLKTFLGEHPDIGFLVLFHWMKMILPRLRQSNRRFTSLFSWGIKAHQIDTLI
jgi:CRP/FNR family transcriptional regulator, cyclic AMP receptor protein